MLQNNISYGSEIAFGNSSYDVGSGMISREFGSGDISTRCTGCVASCISPHDYGQYCNYNCGCHSCTAEQCLYGFSPSIST